MAMKWRKVRNKAEWVCDVCMTCGDPKCCSKPAKWLKRLELTTNAERDAQNDAVWAEDAGQKLHGEKLTDLGGELALCDACFDEWQPRADQAIQESLQRRAR